MTMRLHDLLCGLAPWCYRDPKVKKAAIKKAVRAEPVEASARLDAGSSTGSGRTGLVTHLGRLAVYCVLVSGAHAQAIDPLALTPSNDTPDPAPASSSGLRMEVQAQTADLRFTPAGQARQQQRGVLDFRREWTLRPDWKLGLSNRLEQVHADTGSVTRHALREAYASWRWGEGAYLDAGRVQWRNGVASGFNPSDFLKRGAVLDLGTQNPQALRENRLGTVMLRQQWLGHWGSLQLAYLPKLSSKPPTSTDANPRAPAWERTNAEDAALLRFAPKTGDTWTAESLLYARAGEPLRSALNLTGALGDAWIVHAEWAGGRSSRGAARSSTSTSSSRHDQELAIGASWTTPWGWIATVERHQSSVAGNVSNNSDAWFTRLAWDNAFGLRHINLAAFARINSNDHSRLWQLDARWHLNDHHSLSLIWGQYSGRPGSEYGRVPTRAYGQVAWAVYF